jgi:hypothetical protein
MSVWLGILPHFTKPRLATEANEICPILCAFPLSIVDHPRSDLARMQRGGNDTGKLAKSFLGGSNPGVNQLLLVLWVAA